MKHAQQSGGDEQIDACRLFFLFFFPVVLHNKHKVGPHSFFCIIFQGITSSVKSTLCSQAYKCQEFKFKMRRHVPHNS